jgi:hypothetical protein
MNAAPAIVHREDRGAGREPALAQRLHRLAQRHNRVILAPQVFDPATKQLAADKQPASELIFFCNCEAVIANDAQPIAGKVSGNLEQPEEAGDQQRRPEDSAQNGYLPS